MTVDEIINHKDFPALVMFALRKYKGKSSISLDELIHETRIRIFKSFNESNNQHLKLSSIVVANARWSICGFNRDMNQRNNSFNDSMVKFDILHDDQSYNRALVDKKTTNYDSSNDILEEILIDQPSRTQKIIKMRLEKYTLAEIAECFNISRERVRQIIYQVHKDFKERSAKMEVI